MRALPKENVRVIQVGDHQPEPSIFTRRKAAEQFAVRKVSWSCAEYRDLGDGLKDAALSLRTAVNTENFAGVRSAALSLCELEHQLRELNKGLCHAVEAASKEALK